MEGKLEESLITRLRSGDREAFREAYERHKADVMALATMMLGHRDGTADVLHDVFVSFARQARNLAPGSNLKAYLLKATANRVRDDLAKRKDTPVDWDTTDEPPCSITDTPLTLMAKDEEAHRLWQAVLALPDEQRAVVALRVHGDLTLKEIAEIEGVSENTVQSRYRYALEKLRRAFAGVDR